MRSKPSMVCVCIPLVSSCSISSDGKTTYKTTEGISVTYPKGWTLSSTKLPGFPISLKKDEVVGYGDIACSINLNVATASGEKNDFTSTKEKYKNAFRFNETKLVSESIKKIQGKDTYVVVYYDPELGASMKMLKYIQFKEGKEYISTYLCPEKNSKLE